MVLTEIQLRKSPVYDWDTKAAEIVSIIRLIIRAAIVESPMKTPYSGHKRTTTLAAYGGEH
jgi:hypothetical protein